MSAGPHLDDDALSAHLDGYDDGGAAAHLAGCLPCRARFEALGAAAVAIGEVPPAAPAHDVDIAVAHAIDAESRGSRRPLLVALAAAALMVLGIAGVALVGEEERPSQSDTAALSDSSEQRFGATLETANDDAAFGGDLGDLRDPKALSERVRTVVEPLPTTTAPGGAVAGDAAAVVSPSAAARTAGGSGGSTSSKDPYCQAAVADEYGTGLGRLVYRAVLRWEDTPAVALAYELAQPNGELDHRLYVLAEGTCQLLVAQTF
ncbi:MAG: hypothetical protein M3394_05190 [Actinomycetota bacterium]|nr:hypothetical protein [Actinomycetota bacterium]